MDTIAKTVREIITDDAKVKDEYELKEALILISDALAEINEARKFTDVLDSIISKIVEDGIGTFDSFSVFNMLKTTNEWNRDTILALKHIIWPENRTNETYVAKSRMRFF